MTARVDELGRAYAGSQLQIQIYVNRRTEELNRGVLDALPSLVSSNPRLRWVSPLESEGFVEYQDRVFLRAVGLERLWRTLSRFWPRRGPVWDALAVAEIGPDPDRWGVVLAEGKSHPCEVCGPGCQASERSWGKIEAALHDTKARLGVADEAHWTGPLYQSANRLAHLYFFREVVGVPAWLVNVYFLGDPHSPTTRKDWVAPLGWVRAQLGLTGIDVPHMAEVFLQARDRRELLEPPA